MNSKRHSEPAERILKTAGELFYTQGYAATGVNQIISEAGVARASFYQHFPSKKDLAVAYLRRRHRIWFQWLRSHVERETEPTARLSALFDFLADWLPASGYRGCAFLNMMSESPTLGGEIQAVIKQHKSELRDYIRALTAYLDVSPQEQIADVVLVLFEGAIIECQVMRDLWPIEAAKKGILRLIDR
ncbi:TetR/AcrR family transcriptional regulator [Methylohalobius crimeensis]|uniref:TetR/AcrR family transcriptional regulator n=1 Tax=Methylohalobius crimeensis TaxID=244365 RepID=UPI0003B31753|nr:TetR/AcrR family transcriptional regulator [Methylohalobius crimeensis]